MTSGLPSQLRGYGPFVLVAVAYVAAGKLGIGLEVASGVITPVWAPTGIALFALLVLGIRAWPAIAVAAFVTNITEGAGAGPSAGIALGNTLEALAGAVIFRHLLHGDAALRRARDVVALAFGAGVVSTMISATVGTTTLAIAGDLGGSYWSSWLLWWVGDAMGDVVFAPLLLVWFRPDGWRPSPARLAEGAVLLIFFTGSAAIVFNAGHWQYPYVLFPIMLWAAFRFGQRGATTAVLILTAMAIAGTIGGAVAIVGMTPRETIEIVQVLVAISGIGLMTLAAAVEERSHAEVEVRDSLALHAAVLQSTADGILVVDNAGRIVTSNRQFAEMWGIPLEIVASGDDELAIRSAQGQLQDGDAFVENIRRLYQSGEIEDVSELLFNDGRIFERHSRPYHVEEGSGRVWSFRDVTARRRAEQARERFLTMASHELKSPLTLTVGFMKILLEQWPQFDEGERRDLIERAHDQAVRLSDLVQGLLTATAIESGNLPVRPQPMNVTATVRSVAVDHGGDHVEIVAPDTGVFVLADPAHVHLILVNFLTNAVKYGAPPYRVTVSVAGDDVEVRVADCGAGVPDDVKGSLFGRFVRAASAVETGLPGSGLGLAIARDLARAQGGEVWHEDTRQGACFVLRLPHLANELAAAPRAVKSTGTPRSAS